MSSGQISVGAAATRLGVTAQTVRNWLKSGKLTGSTENRSWMVDERACERLAGSPPSSPTDTSLPVGHDQRLDELAAAVEALVARESASVALVRSLERERD